VLPVVLVSCSTAPSSAAKAICTSVGEELGAPPNAAVAISRNTITDGENSGDPKLDEAVTNLATGLQLAKPNEIRAADRQIETSCRRLGLWTTFHD
jgi:hypothetical protein